MSPWKTLIAGIIFATALGLFIGENVRLKRAEEQRTSAKKLIPESKEKIDRISIVRSGIHFDFRKENERWEILRPILLEADKQAVDDLIFLLDKQQRVGGEKFNPGEAGRFGLEKPALTVSVGGKAGGNEFVFHVGEDSPAHGEVYARMNGEDAWFTIDASLRDHLTRPLYDYRDKTILPLDATKVTTVTLTAAGAQVELARRESGWQITRPISLKADDERVESILKDLQTTKAADFIDTETLDLASFGLQAPTLVAMVSQTADEKPDENQSQRSMLLVGSPKGGDPPTYYALRQGRDLVFTIPQTLFNELKSSVADLRDKRLFSMAPEEVRQLTIESAGQLVSLTRDASGRWRFVDDGVTEVDQNLVNQKIATLLKLKAQNFFNFDTPTELSGLDRPLIRLVISDAGGGINEGLLIGRSGSVGGNAFIYARRPGSEEVFAVAPTATRNFLLSRDMLRDHTLFAFDPSLLARIEVTDKDAKLTFKKEGDSWVGVAEGGRPYQVTTKAIRDLQVALLGLTWDEQLRPDIERDLARIKMTGLESPARTISFLDGSGASLAQIGQANSDNSKIYIRRADKEYYAIDLAKYGKFVAALKDLIPKI